MPGLNQWDAWLEEHPDTDLTSRRILGFRQIEALGGEVLALTADVSDRQQMELALGRAREQFGPIRGAVHAAGIAGGGLMQLKTRQAAAAVLAPKVEGTRVLIDLLEDDELDAMRLYTGYLFQGGALFDSMTVYENLDFLLNRHTKLNKMERRERIEETLAWVKLRDKAPQYPAELSGGQKKRISLARAIILEPEILLYDEPTTGLDPVSVRTVSNLIVRLRDERGITSVAITHDLLCTEIIADTVHFLFDGQIIGRGTLETLRQSDHPELRNFFGI